MPAGGDGRTRVERHARAKCEYRASYGLHVRTRRGKWRSYPVSAQDAFSSVMRFVDVSWAVARNARVLPRKIYWSYTAPRHLPNFQTSIK